jgi:ABC-type nitrate/sulfonate/bicarbonate transport system ATPase subunit
VRNSVIEIDSLNLYIESNYLLSKFSINISKSERVGITGPSGCGKSTLIKSIIKNYLPPNSDSAKFIKNSNANYSFVPQSNGLLPWYSLKRNLELFSKDSDYAAMTISKFKLTESLKNFPHQLSGGEYQRALLARAIINKPDIYLVDEPLTELDITKKWELLSFWSEQIILGNSTLLLVSHDIDTLIYMCDRIVVLSDKPSEIIKEFSIIEKHPRHLDFLISDDFISSKKQLLESINNGK